MCLQKNNLILSGDVVGVPELRKGQGERASICYLYLSQKDKNNRETRFLCKAVGELSEKVARIPAGSNILVFGRLETTKYTAQGNVPASFKSVVVTEIYPSVAGVYLNKAEFAGRLTKKADFFPATAEKKALARTSIAVTYNKGAGTEQSEFIDIVLFDKKAEFVDKYMGKATPATVSGRLALEPYTGKDGSKKVAYRIVASSVEFTQDKAVGNVSATLPADYTPSAQVSSPNVAQNSVHTQESSTPMTDGFEPVSPTADGTFPLGWGNFPID